MSLSAESIASSDGYCGKGYCSVKFSCKFDLKRALSQTLVPLSYLIFLVYIRHRTFNSSPLLQSVAYVAVRRLRLCATLCSLRSPASTILPHLQLSSVFYSGTPRPHITTSWTTFSVLLGLQSWNLSDSAPISTSPLPSSPSLHAGYLLVFWGYKTHLFALVWDLLTFVEWWDALVSLSCDLPLPTHPPQLCWPNSAVLMSRYIIPILKWCLVHHSRCPRCLRRLV
jgi:hypothetical protein